MVLIHKTASRKLSAVVVCGFIYMKTCSLCAMKIQDGIWLPANETVMVFSNRSNFHSIELIDFMINLESDIEVSDEINMRLQ